MKHILLALLLLATVSVQAQLKFFMTKTVLTSPYTVERTWKIKPTNEFLSPTQFTTWAAMPAPSGGVIPAGQTYSNLRDNTNAASTLGFVAVSGFSGSSGSLGPQTGTNINVFCNDQLTSHGWENSGTTTTIKLTGLTAGKYYQLGFYANTANFQANAQSISTPAGSLPSMATGNNYGACGTGEDLDNPVIRWIYNNQADGAGELTITITKTAGAMAALNALIVQQSNVAKP